ncbi:MAG: DUF3784 domain-containing protein [Erysipelotrichaceae bacterium]
MLFELILLSILGFVFIGMGLVIWKKEKINLIHSYHYKKVSEQNKKAYTKGMGIGLITMGVGMLLSGGLNYVANTHYGWFLFGFFFGIGISIILKVQKKYNGGVF